VRSFDLGSHGSLKSVGGAGSRCAQCPGTLTSLHAASRRAPPAASDPPRSRSQLGEGPFRVPPELSDAVGPIEVGEHEDVEQLGAGSRTEGVEAIPEAASSSGRIAGAYATTRPVLAACVVA
jgi:hypothetical protein